MYTQTWNKYLPVLRILLKRAVETEQTFALTTLDFEKTGSAAKTGHKFAIHFLNGKVDNGSGLPVVAKELASVLLADSQVKQILQANEYEISLTKKYQLTLKAIPLAVPEEAIVEEA